jgi:uncharacterized protein (TIGR03083 family)
MTMTISLTENDVQLVREIPKLSHAEAGELSQVEYERLLAVLESLAGEEWQQPTYCSEWDVRDMVAHLAGAVTGSASFNEFKRQNVSNPYLKQFENPVDGTNKLQLEERKDKTLEELVAEFRQNGQIAIDNRQSLPWPIRKIHLPMGELGFTSIEYLMDVIYPRDQWMHRYDICAAAGKKMSVTPEHDGRMTALVLLDIAKKLKKDLADRSILLALTGAVQAEYQFGRGGPVDCTISIDLFDFHLRASGRISTGEAMMKAAVSGDETIASWFLDNLEVSY